MSSRRRIAFFTAVAVASAVACKVTTSNDTTLDAGSSDAGQTSQDNSSCTLGTEAQNRLRDAATALTSKDLSCTTDDDCAFASTSCSCCGGCGGGGYPIAAKDGPAYRAVVDDVEAKDCAPFRENNCPNVIPPCPPPAEAVVPACVGGACAFAPPPDWTSFSFEEISPDGGAGEERTVTPGGQLTITNPSRNATLSPADAADVDRILRSSSFRVCVWKGSCLCGSKWLSPNVMLSVLRGADRYTIDASACADTPNGDLGTLYTIVHEY
jgi:hypothetical protein